MNVKEIAQELGLSSAIVTMHIKKLEEAKLSRQNVSVSERYLV